MNGLQSVSAHSSVQRSSWVSIVCLLVKMTFVQGTALSCPTCPPGFFMVKNCSKTEGTQCRDCTNCSALHQVALSSCTPWTDTVCGNKTVTENTAKPAGRHTCLYYFIVSQKSEFLITVLLLSHSLRQGNDHPQCDISVCVSGARSGSHAAVLPIQAKQSSVPALNESKSFLVPLSTDTVGTSCHPGRRLQQIRSSETRTQRSGVKV